MSLQYQQSQPHRDRIELSHLLAYSHSQAIAAQADPLNTHLEAYGILVEKVQGGISYVGEALGLNRIADYFTEISNQGYGLIMTMSNKRASKRKKENQTDAGMDPVQKRKKRHKGNRDQRKERLKEQKRREKDERQKNKTGKSKYAKKEEEIQEWKKAAKRRADSKTRSWGYDPYETFEERLERIRRQRRSSYDW